MESFKQINESEMVVIDLENDNKPYKETTIPIIETKKPYWRTSKFFIEFLIFFISVSGAICVATHHFEGFFAWLVSNTIALIYFLINKQYPLSIQQSVFLCTTLLGIYESFIKVTPSIDLILKSADTTIISQIIVNSTVLSQFDNANILCSIVDKTLTCEISSVNILDEIANITENIMV